MTTWLFQLTFLLAAPFWALMILAPSWRWTSRIIGSPLIVLPPVLIYVVLVLPNLLEVLLPIVSSPTLIGVQTLLGTPTGAAIGWAHFVAFDLFVGRWEYRDGRERQIAAWLMAPVLLLTLLFGPLGLLVYLLLRTQFKLPAAS